MSLMTGKFDEWVKLPAKFGLSSHGEVHVIMNFTVSSTDDNEDRKLNDIFI